jgi:WD40 repeat protein
MNSTILSVRYSYSRPNILAVSDEQGFLTLINTQVEKFHKSVEFNNTLDYHQIIPIFSKQFATDSIFDFEWCFNDNKILTAGGDGQSHLINLENGKNCSELQLCGHTTKSTKSIKQAFYDPNLIASCGRDGMLFIWDVRLDNKKLCNAKCRNLAIPHIHVKKYFNNFSLLEVFPI